MILDQLSTNLSDSNFKKLKFKGGKGKTRVK